MSERASTVVVGGGIVGCAVAHFLAERREPEVLPRGRPDQAPVTVDPVPADPGIGHGGENRERHGHRSLPTDSQLTSGARMITLDAVSKRFVVGVVVLGLSQTDVGV